MTDIARKGDKTTGHGGYGPQTILAGSPNVKINNKPSARKGDPVSVHSNGRSSHSSIIGGGAPRILVNGKPKARKGDPIACGGSVMNGSSNVRG